MQYFSALVIRAIARKPGMYFGSPPSFRSFYHYYQGVWHTLRKTDAEHPLVKEMDGFQDWIQARAGRRILVGGWLQYLEEDEKEEVRRFELFSELYLEYRVSAGYFKGVDQWDPLLVA